MEQTVNSGSRSQDLNVIEADEGELDVRELAGFVSEGRRLVALIGGGVFLLGLAYALIASPVYRADSAVQVESKSPMGSLSALKDVSVLLGGGGTPTDTEMEVMRSRQVVGEAVEAMQLDLDVRPNRLPLLGGAISRMHGNDSLADPVLGLTGWAWGGERLKIDQFKLPRSLEGEKLALEVRDHKAYRLVNGDGTELVSGVVGKVAEGRDGISILVSDLVAHPGLTFRVGKRSTQETITLLQETLQIREKGKKTGVVEVALEGPDAAKVTATVNALVKAYYDLNVERRTTDAERTMSFLRTELPRLRAEAQTAEQALTQYGSRRGAIDLGMEAKAAGEAMAEIEKQLAVARLQRAELQTRFTAQSSIIVALDERMQQLEREKTRLDQRLKGLPEPQIEGLRLQRDAKVANELYLQVFGKVQELSVAKAIAIGNVRILDPAVVPEKPVKPKRLMVVVAAAVLGLLLGIATVIARGLMFRRIENAQSVERRLGLQVLGSIPRSAREAEPALTSGSAGLLALAAPQDPSMEAMRGLAAALQFNLIDAQHKIIALTGPDLGVGKSFVAANLAVTLAESGKSVVLVDGDMRGGRLHELFGHSGHAGLSGLLTGDTPMSDALKPTPLGNLKLIPAGNTPANPSSLLMSDRFRKLIEILSKQVDYLIIDAPPVMGVTDPMIIGRLASATCLVLRAGEHRMQDVEACYRQLAQHGVKVQGAVLNFAAEGGPGYAQAKNRARLGKDGAKLSEAKATGGLKRLFSRKAD